MTRNSMRIALLVLVPMAAVLPAQSASASGGPSTCTATTFYSAPLPLKATTFTAENAGSVVIKPDPAGLNVVKVNAMPGWSKSVGIKVGSEVDVDFQNGNIRKKFKAAGTAAYYGSLQVEIDTCM